MIEYKVKYEHEKARRILDEIGAVFADKKQHDDFYLKAEKGNILKLQKSGDDIYLVNLIHEDGGFVENVSEYLSKDISGILSQLFKDNHYVIRKMRESYSWKGSKIRLDTVQGYGEFVEFYPADEESKIEIFEKFGVKESDLVTKSYFDL